MLRQSIQQLARNLFHRSVVSRRNHRRSSAAVEIGCAGTGHSAELLELRQLLTAVSPLGTVTNNRYVFLESLNPDNSAQVATLTVDTSQDAGVPLLLSVRTPIQTADPDATFPTRVFFLITHSIPAADIDFANGTFTIPANTIPTNVSDSAFGNTDLEISGSGFLFDSEARLNLTIREVEGSGDSREIHQTIERSFVMQASSPDIVFDGVSLSGTPITAVDTRPIQHAGVLNTQSVPVPEGSIQRLDILPGGSARVKVDLNELTEDLQNRSPSSSTTTPSLIRTEILERPADWDLQIRNLDGDFESLALDREFLVFAGRGGVSANGDAFPNNPGEQFFIPTDLELRVTPGNGASIGEARIRVTTFQAGLQEFIPRDVVEFVFDNKPPADLVIDGLGQDVFVTDNNRTTLEQATFNKQFESAQLDVENELSIPQTFRLHATSNPGVRHFYTILGSTIDITDALTGDGFVTPLLQPGEKFSIDITTAVVEATTLGQITSNVVSVFAEGSDNPVDQIGLETVAFFGGFQSVDSVQDDSPLDSETQVFPFVGGVPIQARFTVENRFLDFPASLLVTARITFKQGSSTQSLPNGLTVQIHDTQGVDVTALIDGNSPFMTQELAPFESTDFLLTITPDPALLRDLNLQQEALVSVIFDGVVPESNEAMLLTVLVPDLIPQQEIIAVVQDGPDGQELSVNYQVVNAGATAVRELEWTDLLALDVNNNGQLDSGDRPLGTVKHTQNARDLKPTDVYAEVLTIPVNQMPSGEFRVLIQADSSRDVIEPDEEFDEANDRNNIAVSNTTVLIENNAATILVDNVQVERNDDGTASVSGIFQDPTGGQQFDVRLLDFGGQVLAQQQVPNNGGQLAFNILNVQPPANDNLGIVEIQNELGNVLRQFVNFAASFDIRLNVVEQIIADLQRQGLFLNGSEIIANEGSENIEVTLSSDQGTFTQEGSNDPPAGTTSIRGAIAGINNDIVNRIRFTPNDGFLGDAIVGIQVQDTDDPSKSTTTNVTTSVVAENRAPVITQARAVITEADGRFKLFADVVDPDGDEVTVAVTLAGQPIGSALTEFPDDPVRGLSTDPTSLPDVPAGGPYPDVVITATDSSGLQSTRAVTLFIADPRIRTALGDGRAVNSPGRAELSQGTSVFSIVGSDSTDAVVRFSTEDGEFLMGIGGTQLVDTNGNATFDPIQLSFQNVVGLLSVLDDGDDVLLFHNARVDEDADLGSTPGDDLMIIQDTTYAGDLNIDVGPDEDVGTDDDLVFIDNVTVVGNATVQTGNGNDRLESMNVALDGDLEIRAGAGDDHVDASGTTVGGVTNIDAGTGNDSVIGTAGDDVIRVADGGDTINGGGGNDRVFVEAGDRPVRREGNLIFIGDDDPIALTDVEDVQFVNSSATPLVIDLSLDDDTAELIDNGDGSFTLQDLDVTFGGDLTFIPPAGGVIVNGLDGFDVIDFSAATFAVTLNGDGDDDELTGGTQNDTLNGGDGDDTLIGFLGADQQFGGEGDDTFEWNNGDGPDDNFGEAGDDTLQFNGADGANDAVRLAPAADIGSGGDGTHPSPEFDLTRTLPTAFTIENSGIENAVISGQAGDDLLDASALPDGLLSTIALVGGDGNDELLGSQGIDILIGNDGNDRLIGNRGADLVLGDSDAAFEFPTGDIGDDTFIWNNGDGADDVDLEFGTDTFIFNGADGGTDIIRIAPSADTGEAGDGTLINAQVDLTRTAPSAFTIETAKVEFFEINGLGGSDVIDASFVPAGLLQGTRIDGGDGDDELAGTQGNDVLIGASGDDILRGQAGDDILAGGAGRDRLDGGDGDDRLRGQGASGDVLSGGAGDDELDGGSGMDRVVEDGDTDFTATDAALTGLGSNTLLGIELLTLNGGGSANRIDTTAFSGDVVLNGRGGNDTLLAGDGNDILNGGGGRDRLHGGVGNDRVRGQGSIDELAGGPGNDTIDGGAGNDLLVEEGDVDFVLSNLQLTGLGTDSLSGILRATLRGGASNNHIDATAFSGSVSMLGFGGDDILLGGASADQLRGGAGRDTLRGNGGRDALFGQGSSGDDLDGGSEADLLDGGAGRDRIRADEIDTVVEDALDMILMP